MGETVYSKIESLQSLKKYMFHMYLTYQREPYAPLYEFFCIYV